MPVMDGYETIRAIRAIDRFKTLPIIAVTGKATAGERQRCLDAGASDYVPKPVDTAELLAALRPWLPADSAAGRMTARPAPRASRRLPDAAATTRRPDPGRRRQRRASGSRCKSVLSPLGYSIVEADSGLAALRCVMAQDFAVILLDVRMPIMDGFETAALIRQRRQSEMTPIIFITAYGSDEIVNTDLYAEGAVDFIFAPVPPERAPGEGLGVREPLHARPRSSPTQAREVQTSADQLRLLTDAAPIGIFQTDADEPIRLHEPALERDHRHLRARRRSGRSGRRSSARRSARGLGHRARPTDAVPSAELSRRFEIQLLRGAASRIVLVTSRSIPDSDGGIDGLGRDTRRRHRRDPRTRGRAWRAGAPRRSTAASSRRRWRASG